MGVVLIAASNPSDRQQARNDTNRLAAFRSDEEPAKDSLQTRNSQPILSISGKVTSGTMPVSGVALTLFDHRSLGQPIPSPSDLLATTTTSTDGTYEMQTTHCGAWLRAEKSGHAVVSADPDLVALELNQDGSAKQDLDLPLALPVKGCVVDEAGEAVPGATIVARPYFDWGLQARARRGYPVTMVTTSTADGDFVFASLVAATYTLVAEQDGRVPAVRDVAVPANNVVLQTPHDGGSIEGRVVMVGTQQSVSSATVSVTLVRSRPAGLPTKDCPLSNKAITDALGSFRLERLPEGTFDVWARKEGLIPHWRGGMGYAKLRSRETTSGLCLTMYEGYTITGVVRDSVTRKPIEGAEVSHGTVRVLTDAQGRFRLERLGPQMLTGGGARMSLSATHEGYSRGRWNRLVSPEVFTGEIEIGMQRTVVLSGLVRTSDGKPVAGATVQPFVEERGDYSRGSWHRKVTDSAGRYEMEVAPFSELRVIATVKDRAATYTLPIKVGYQSLTAPDIVLPAR